MPLDAAVEHHHLQRVGVDPRWQTSVQVGVRRTEVGPRMLGAGLPAGVYTYRLEVVMLDGRVERYGLVSVSVP